MAVIWSCDGGSDMAVMVAGNPDDVRIKNKPPTCFFCPQTFCSFIFSNLCCQTEVFQDCRDWLVEWIFNPAHCQMLCYVMCFHMWPRNNAPPRKDKQAPTKPTNMKLCLRSSKYKWRLPLCLGQRQVARRNTFYSSCQQNGENERVEEVGAADRGLL